MKEQLLLPIKLGDADLMPVGKHAGTRMADVPVDYLHYLWRHGKKDLPGCPVADYIRRNLPAFKIKYSAGIW
jgi:uncharacterized protein (DUF3820 family)